MAVGVPGELAGLYALHARFGARPWSHVVSPAAALARNGEFKEAELWQKRCLTLLKEDADLPDEDRSKLASEFANSGSFFSSPA